MTPTFLPFIDNTHGFQDVPPNLRNCDFIEAYGLEYRLPSEDEWTSVWDLDEPEIDDIQTTTVTNLTASTVYEVRMAAAVYGEFQVEEKFGPIVTWKTIEGGKRS